LITGSKLKAKIDRQKSEKDKENTKTKEEHSETSCSGESTSGEITSQETGEVDNVAGGSNGSPGPQVEFTKGANNSR